MGKSTVEIRWHGRGGQGAKTACLLLADVAFYSGKHVQGFPEYGPERMGAPITAYNRITDKRCTVHSNIYSPDYVIVVDETLLGSVDVTSGLKEEGAIIINSEKEPEELRSLLGGFKGQVCSIDARRISEETIGRNMPNTPMLAAAVKISKIVEQEQFIRDMESSLRHKFTTKPQVVSGNMEALRKSMEEVKVG
ncbi:pyruvate synthase [Aminipila butyrica]|uniref:Pyruvate synthase n=1 Tax=Aminipila butyrica TaxID=433296 RepID=A0A858BXB6_9FIRM|nr:2-oxoacid:acceptor oxidoreductase family protein [Aminipila butyrica]QIB69725.1 pyruvate synthase [Aminipila butyrica]